MSNYDQFETEYHVRRFPDKQDIPLDEYSTCSGCGEVIYVGEDILDVYGMSIHNDFDCLRKAVEAKIIVAIKEE